MRSPESTLRHRREYGGILIIVVLMLLVLMTIMALAMSKNSLREVIITGTSRQSAQVQSLADSGLDWSIFWMMGDSAMPSASTGSGAADLRAKRDTLVSNLSMGTLSPKISTADMTVGSSTDPTQRFEVYLTYMGNPTPLFTGSAPNASSINAASAAGVQLWSVRSDGYVEYSAGLTFLHRREAWFTMPPYVLPTSTP